MIKQIKKPTTLAIYSLLALALMYQEAKAGDFHPEQISEVHCLGANGASLNLFLADDYNFIVTLDKSLSIAYLGAITSDQLRTVAPVPVAVGSQALEYKDWDGNSGIELSISNTPVPESANYYRAQLRVYAEERESEEAVSELICSLNP